MALTEVFTGAHGTLSLASEDTAEGADAKNVVDTYAIETIGRLTGVTVTVDTALKEFYEVGRRHPVSLSPGDIAVSGTVARAYINGALVTLLLGRGAAATAIAEPYVQPSFIITLTLLDPARTDDPALLEIRGVKFQNWRFTLPEDDFVLESLCFKALSVAVLEVPTVEFATE